MNKVFDIMVAGHLCLDIIPKFYDTGARKIEQIMRPGKLVNITEAKISTGGPVSNTGINMKTLGANVCFCARVGDDEFGKITIDLLRQNGNADGVKSIANTVSSYTIVIAPAGIDRIFLHNPGTNDTFAPEDLDIEMIAKCTHFHFGYPPLMHNIYIDDGRKLTEVFKIAKLAGATTSCDMTLPDPKSESGKVNWRKVLQNTLPYIDIFLPSVEETFYMLHPQDFLNMKAEHNNAELIDFFKPGDYTNIANEILSMGAKIVSLKSGHRGFYIKTSSKDKFDTFGAGRPADFYNWSNRELWCHHQKLI
jgi:sugar/nucleoside kinase (ribokinase family)